MNTPAHLIFGVAAFGRPDATRVTIAALFGAMLPDLSLYGLAGWELIIQGTRPNVVFGQMYYSEEWQRIFRIDNSFVLWGIACGIALMLKSRVLIALTGAVLLHLLLDFPLHNDDARAHFWPITDWKFISPVSYWDPQYYGHIVGPIEIGAVLICSLYVLKRFKDMVWVQIMAVAFALLQIAPMIAWIFFFGGA